jgi:hypothetical protein
VKLIIETRPIALNFSNHKGRGKPSAPVSFAGGRTFYAQFTEFGATPHYNAKLSHRKASPAL